MKPTTKKKSLLAVASSLTAPAMALIARGQYYEGGILVAMSAACFLAYDYYDDRVKGNPTLPDGVTSDMLEDVASSAADSIDEAIDSSSDDS